MAVPADVPLGRTLICGLSLAVAQGLGAAGTGLLRHLRASSAGTNAINLIIDKFRWLAHVKRLRALETPQELIMLALHGIASDLFAEHGLHVILGQRRKYGLISQP